jgi:hypothetical protein
MRFLQGLAALTLSFPVALPVAVGQAPPPSPGASAKTVESQAPTVPAAVDESAALKRIATQLELVKLSGGGGTLPTAESFTIGGRTIPKGTVITGPVGIANGSLEVYGKVDGNALAIQGDIRVHNGGEVTGDAVAVGGRVRIDGGLVDGEIRSLSSLIPGVHVPVAPAPPSVWRSLKLVVAWFAILAIIGIGIMIFAERSLDGVVHALERGIGKSFLAGLLGQVVALPVLLLLLVALSITLIGVLLVPFAIVAYVIAMMGLVTLGFLAVARLTGSAVIPEGSAATERGDHLRALLVGVSGYMALWAVAAVALPSPVASTILRGIALGVTWVAATVGLGGTLISRAGTLRAGTTGRFAAASATDYAWQTPTPVTGVSAARRGTSREVS